MLLYSCTKDNGGKRNPKLKAQKKKLENTKEFTKDKTALGLFLIKKNTFNNS